MISEPMKRAIRELDEKGHIHPAWTMHHTTQRALLRRRLIRHVSLPGMQPIIVLSEEGMGLVAGFGDGE